MTVKPTIACVIRTLNEAKYLKETIRRIYLQEGVHVHVIIVDSGSTDQTVQIALDMKCIVKTIHSSEWSWGRALNVGIEGVDADFIFLTSAHCFFPTNQELLKAIRLMQNLDVLYGQHIPIPDVDPFEEFELYQSFPDEDFVDLSYDAIFNGRGVGISNACCLFRTTVWHRLTFDESLSSAEDFYWALEASKLNFRIAYSSQIKLYHSHPLDIQTIYKRWYFRAREILKLMHGSNILRMNLKRRILLKARRQFPVLFSIYVFYKDYSSMHRFFARHHYIKVSHIWSFLLIKHTAVFFANKDYYKNQMDVRYNDTFAIPRFIKKRFSSLEASMDFVQGLTPENIPFH